MKLLKIFVHEVNVSLNNFNYVSICYDETEIMIIQHRHEFRTKMSKNYFINLIHYVISLKLIITIKRTVNY